MKKIENKTLNDIYDRLSSSKISIEEERSLNDSLNNLSAESLSEPEKNLRDFLSIKSADKAYILHTDDSLYLKVNNYFSNHHKEYLPEVLYYGGRVYSDMGDYPTALKYFNDALEQAKKTNGD